MKDVQKIEQYLVGLGLDSEAIRIYLELLKAGSPSVLQLAKSLSISRTQIYRHLEQLKDYNLVSVEKLDYGSRYLPLPLDNVEAVITERQADLQHMKQQLGGMSQLVREFVADGPQKTLVRHYYGVSGLKQANWNLTKAQGEYRVFEAGHLPEHFDESFARRCNARLTERKLVSYDITNKTKVHIQELEPCDPNLVNYRYIDPKILSIDFEIYIYNYVVTLLDYNPKNLQAIEIEHPALHSMMEQMHRTIWGIGKPLELSRA